MARMKIYGTSLDMKFHKSNKVITKIINKMILPDKIVEVLLEKACSCISVRDLAADNDYERFAMAIADITNTPEKSISTWKRVFGRLSRPDGGRYETSPGTCQIIAEFLGCTTWTDLFDNTDEIYERCSGAAKDVTKFVGSNDETLTLIKSLKQGDRIKVCYYPQRELVLEFISVNRYKIVDKTRNVTQLNNGDILEIPSLIKRHPFSATMVKRNDAILGPYHSAGTHTIEEISLLSRR